MARSVDPLAVLPPHNLQIEEALLGALILQPTYIDDVIREVRAEDFYRQSHSTIFDSIVSVYDESNAVDVATVLDHLKRGGHVESIGGDHVIGNILAATPAMNHAPVYAKQVREYSRLRHLFHTANSVRDLLIKNTDQDSQELLDQVEAEWGKLRDTASSQITTASHAMAELWNELDDRIENRGVVKSPTGWPDLDRIIGGLRPGVLYVMAARPGVGKSSWAGQLALNVASRGAPVLFCTMEMNEVEIIRRMAGAEADVVFKKIDEGTIDKAEYKRLEQATGLLGNLPLWFDDSPTQSLFDIKSSARRLSRTVGDVGLIVVDYLQLMKPTRGSSKPEYRQQEVATIVRGLKELARELGVPIVALSQLNRGIESRAIKRPQMSDLRESGEIENAADKVMFIHREVDLDGLVIEPYKAEVIVAKNRGGPTGSAMFAVDLGKAQWKSAAPSYRTIPA